MDANLVFLHVNDKYLNLNNSKYKYIHKVIRLSQVESTNTYVRELSNNNPTSGTVVITACQSKGRGLQNNKWHSGDGQNVTFSLFLRDFKIDIKDIYHLNMIVALAIVDAVKTLGLNAEIKWPNDIYIGKKKLCGILVENTLTSRSVSATIIGIGLNVNEESFPTNIPNPTSLRLETGVAFDIEDVFERILSAIDIKWDMLLSKDYGTIKKNYIDCLFQYNKVSKYMILKKQMVVDGTIIDVDSNGLVVLAYDDIIEAFGLKEIKYIL